MKIASLHHFLFLPFSLFSQSLSTRKSFSSVNTLAVHLSPPLSFFFILLKKRLPEKRQFSLLTFCFIPVYPLTLFTFLLVCPSLPSSTGSTHSGQKCHPHPHYPHLPYRSHTSGHEPRRGGADDLDGRNREDQKPSSGQP